MSLLRWTITILRLYSSFIRLLVNIWGSHFILDFTNISWTVFGPTFDSSMFHSRKFNCLTHYAERCGRSIVCENEESFEANFTLLKVCLVALTRYHVIFRSSRMPHLKASAHFCETAVCLAENQTKESSFSKSLNMPRTQLDIAKAQAPASELHAFSIRIRVEVSNVVSQDPTVLGIT